jgi:hypothetical protein
MLKMPPCPILFQHYQSSIEMTRRDFLHGHWKPYLLRALTLQPCYDGPTNGGEVAARILEDTAVGKKCISDKVSYNRVGFPCLPFCSYACFHPELFSFYTSCGKLFSGRLEDSKLLLKLSMLHAM